MSPSTPNTDRPSPDSTTVASALRTLGITADTYGPTVNTRTDPASTEVIGHALAEALREPAPEHIAIWLSPDDAVLAHIVARELGATVIVATEQEGVLRLQPPPAAGAPVALLASAWRPRQRRALHALTAATGAEIVAVAAVTNDSAAADTEETDTGGAVVITLVPAVGPTGGAQ